MFANMARTKPCMAYNRDGDEARKGGVRGSGGFTKKKPAALWYCGKTKNQCKCGKCNGTCGPSNGCPCQACYALYLDEVGSRGD